MGQQPNLPQVSLEFENGRIGSEKKQAWPIENSITLLGRRSCCDIRFADESVSRVHASLILTPRGCGSWICWAGAGRRINGVSSAYAYLHDGSQIEIGSYKIRVRYHEDQARPHPAEAVLDEEPQNDRPHRRRSRQPRGTVSEDLLYNLVTNMAEMQKQMFDQSQLQIGPADSDAGVGPSKPAGPAQDRDQPRARNYQGNARIPASSERPRQTARGFAVPVAEPAAFFSDGLGERPIQLRMRLWTRNGRTMSCRLRALFPVQRGRRGKFRSPGACLGLRNPTRSKTTRFYSSGCRNWIGSETAGCRKSSGPSGVPASRRELVPVEASERNVVREQEKPSRDLSHVETSKARRTTSLQSRLTCITSTTRVG